MLKANNKKEKLLIPIGSILSLKNICLDPNLEDQTKVVVYICKNNDSIGIAICQLSDKSLETSQRQIDIKIPYTDDFIFIWCTGGDVHIIGHYENMVYSKEIDSSKKRTFPQEDILSSDSNNSNNSSNSSGNNSNVDLSVWNYNSNSSQSKRCKSIRAIKKPSGITITDHSIGNGAEPTSGSIVKITYEGFFADGSPFDKKGSEEVPFVFRKGIGQVIEGLDLGLEGMRVGGYREIQIPSELG